ncbi:hypothetical protein BDW69DRAFT_179054 [Aspergillus filifer]
MEHSSHRVTSKNTFPTMPLLRSSSLLEEGRYVLLSVTGHPISVRITDEPALYRLPTPKPLSGQENQQPPNQRYFQERIQERDDVGVVTGDRGPIGEKFCPLKATHIFPVAMRETWGMISGSEMNYAGGNGKSDG